MTAGADVRCPTCGRVYGPGVFPAGRVIDCTCGTRIGPEPAARPLPRGRNIRLFADAMLGRLARWLRVLGFDTAYEADIADAALVRRSLDERRVIVSRDRRLPREWRVTEVLVLDGDDTLEQLRQVLDHFELWSHLHPFTRCSRCNAPLRTASPAAVAGRVPPAVRARVSAYTQCPRCARVYWHGSHTGRVLRVLEGMRARRIAGRRGRTPHGRTGTPRRQ